MQISKDIVREMKLKLKRYYPQGYANIIHDRLLEKGCNVSRQQVYNFFNDISVSSRNEILNAALELLAEGKQELLKIEERVKKNL